MTRDPHRRDPHAAADLLTDVAYFVEDDNGEWATVFDGEVIQAELVDEPEPAPVEAMVGVLGPDWTDGRSSVEFVRQQRDTQWLPTKPEPAPNPRHVYPDEPTPIFDELDQRRLRRKSWTKTSHDLQTALDRWKAQHRLEEGAHRDRVWEIEHASPLLNQLGQP